MSWLKNIFENIIAPLVVAILTPVVIALGSRATKGDYLEWFTSIPTWVYYVFAAMVVVWVITVLIQKRRKSLQKEALPIGVIRTPLYGWMNVGEIKYSGVVWRIEAPDPGPAMSRRGPLVTPKDLRVSMPPRCPKCKTELDQHKRFIGGYRWKCDMCNFKSWRWSSFYDKKNAVMRIARREVEKQMAQGD